MLTWLDKIRVPCWAGPVLSKLLMSYQRYMEGLARDVAAITGWEAEKLRAWSKPLKLAAKPLDHVLLTLKSGNQYPSQAC